MGPFGGPQCVRSAGRCCQMLDQLKVWIERAYNPISHSGFAVFSHSRGIFRRSLRMKQSKSRMNAC